MTIFERPSTRTRLSFEIGMYQLGGFVVNITPKEMQLGRGETIADSARILSRYADAVMIRAAEHDTILEFAGASQIPVINGLSNIEHPCQAISDLFTIHEMFGRLKGINVLYVGDGNNVCNSLMLGCAMSGANITVACPEGYEPDSKMLAKAEKAAKAAGSKVRVANDPGQFLSDADVVYTDVWVSMGMEDQTKERLGVFKKYQINSELMGKTKETTKVMHCLPAHRGQEITGDVIDGAKSVVWQQGENRLHAQKAILLELLK